MRPDYSEDTGLDDSHILKSRLCETNKDPNESNAWAEEHSVMGSRNRRLVVVVFSPLMRFEGTDMLG